MKTRIPSFLAAFFCAAMLLLAASASAAADVAVNEVNFPDETFRNYVSSKIDKDGNGILSETECNAVSSLYLGNTSYLYNMAGIEFFPNLKTLSCYMTRVNSLDVSHNPKLRSLSCFDTSVSELNLRNCPELVELNCSRSKITSLDLSACTNLKTLECSNYNTGLEELVLPNTDTLEKIDLTGAKITSIDVSKYVNLKELVLSDSGITSLDVTNCPLLTKLWISSTGLSSIDLSKNTQLKSLLASSCNLSSLNLSNNTALQTVTCFANNLTKLDVSKCSELQELNCYRNNLTSLDLTHNSALRDLNCTENFLLTVDLRNTLVWTSSSSGYRGYVGRQKNDIIMTALVTDVQAENLAPNISPNNQNSNVQLNTAPSTVAIMQQPESVYALEGKTVTLSVVATGTNLTYQWQYATGYSGPWTNCTETGSKTATLKLTMSSAVSDRYYHCVVTSGSYSATSERGYLAILEAPRYLQSPETISGTFGEEAGTYFGVSGYNLTYQWQISNSEDGPWSNYTGDSANAARLRIIMVPELVGKYFRCICSNEAGSVTSCVVTVWKAEPHDGLAILSHPEDVFAAPGSTVRFSVTVDTKSDYEYFYQWQYCTSTGDTWRDCTGESAKWPTYSFTMAEIYDGRRYRCVIEKREQSVGGAYIIETDTSRAALLTLDTSSMDTESPTISATKVTAITPNVFTIRAEATDNDKISKLVLSAWPDSKTESDAWKTETTALTQSGTKYSASVNFSVSTLGNFHDCYYNVRVTAYDPTGNFKSSDVLKVYVPMLRRSDNRLFLPDSTTTVAASAFENDKNIGEVILSDKVQTIGSRAFANCTGLVLIQIPNSVKTISSDAFTGSSKVIFLCTATSPAAAYATAHNIPWISALP